MTERAEIFRQRQRFEHEQLTPILPVVGQLQKNNSHWSLPNINTVRIVISSDLRCQNVPLAITDMFVRENISLIDHNIVWDKTRTFSVWFMIYRKRFCYYSVAWPNVLWLIEEKGCWVVL